MERRFRVRLDELLDDAQVRPGLLRGVRPRRDAFLQPFVARRHVPEQRTNTPHDIQGLLSELDGKDVESIADRHDRERQGLQTFIGQAPWDHRPLADELTPQVGTALGEADGVLVFDPSAFPKKGTASVGVQRPWCGRLGKIDNCRVGIDLGSVSRREHARVDFRLDRPKEWATSRTRRRKAGVPKSVRVRTRPELIPEMLDERSAALPHAGISGDDELGRGSWFRPQLAARGECYLLAVPSNTTVRDLRAAEPPYDGHGRRPRVPFGRVDDGRAAVPESAWQAVEVRDGEKGPVVVQAVWALAPARTEGRASDVAESLVVVRERQGDGTGKHDYLLSNAALGTPLTEFARVFKAQHRIEECLPRAKSEAARGDDQVRTWEGWHHHQTLSLVATGFLTQETRRGKNADAGVDGPAGAVADRRRAEPSGGISSAGADSPPHESPFEAERRRATRSLATPQALAAASV